MGQSRLRTTTVLHSSQTSQKQIYTKWEIRSTQSDNARPLQTRNGWNVAVEIPNKGIKSSWQKILKSPSLRLQDGIIGTTQAHHGFSRCWRSQWWYGCQNEGYTERAFFIAKNWSFAQRRNRSDGGCKQRYSLLRTYTHIQSHFCSFFFRADRTSQLSLLSLSVGVVNIVFGIMFLFQCLRPQALSGKRTQQFRLAGRRREYESRWRTDQKHTQCTGSRSADVRHDELDGHDVNDEARGLRDDTISEALWWLDSLQEVKKRVYGNEMVEFCEMVMLKKAGQHMMKLYDCWLRPVLSLDMSNRDVEHLVTLHRLPMRLLWDADAVSELSITSWETKIKDVKTLELRRMFISNQMKTACGPSDRCNNCRRQGRTHSEYCREHFENICEQGERTRHDCFGYLNREAGHVTRSDVVVTSSWVRAGGKTRAEIHGVSQSPVHTQNVDNETDDQRKRMKLSDEVSMVAELHVCAVECQCQTDLRTLTSLRKVNSHRTAGLITQRTVQ